LEPTPETSSSFQGPRWQRLKPSLFPAETYGVEACSLRLPQIESLVRITRIRRLAMKSRFLWIAATVLIFFGLVSGAAVIDEIIKGKTEDRFLGCTIAVCFTAGGILLLRALKARYPLNWRIFMGAFLAFFGIVGASVETDALAHLRSEQPVLGFTVAAVFVVVGSLLARSGHRRNLVHDKSHRPGAGPFPAARCSNLQETAAEADSGAPAMSGAGRSTEEQ
jgi:hypothetical protein